MSAPTPRIAALREHALNAKDATWRREEYALLWSRGWMAASDLPGVLRRRARASAHAFVHATPVIDEGELIVGKPCRRVLEAAEAAELEQWRQNVQKAIPWAGGQGSHMAVDYEKLLSLGVSGIQDEIRRRRADLGLEGPEEIEKDDFYQACLDVLDGLLAYADHYAAAADRMAAECADPARKAELERIARNCRRVPRHPAESFYEALQSIQFVTFCLHGLYQFGRPDRYLYPYYKRDLDAGRLTREFAQELIDCICILFNEYVPRGLAVGFMVGGRDPAGRDVTNELSHLFVESVGHTRMIYPGVGLCCTSETPEDLLVRSCELLAEGLSHPALFNDDVITRGLRGYGLPPEDACLYINSTCVEITPIATSGVWVASPYHNLAQFLLDVIEGRAFASFDDLKAAYRVRLAERVRDEAIICNRTQAGRFHVGGDPLVSCFVNDCLTRGRDIDQGGARYNWIMPSFVGLANLADSLMTIKRLVFDERKLGLAELAGALKDDFRGRETLRQEILNRLPKYGNDDDTVDGIVREVTGWVQEEVAKYRTWRGDRFIPSFFCWVMHERLGSLTGATPDGRCAGFPLGDGSGPAQGRERCGPTASILSSTKWDHAPFIGGIAVNMKFSRSLFKPESIGKMVALVRTFMARGGFELQINVVDRDVLLNAKRNPEQYEDLVVRIGGYSDYFVHLTPAMQDEVIQRTEHAI